MVRMLLRIFVALVFSSVVARPAAALVVFDHIGTPAETSDNPTLSSMTNTANTGDYATAAARFQLPPAIDHVLGGTLSTVVWGQGPQGVGSIPDWNQVQFYVEIWNSNPGIGSDAFAERGNLISGRRPLADGSLIQPWGSTGGVDTYLIQFDLSDVEFVSGVEYWVSVRTWLNFDSFGRSGTVVYDGMGIGGPDVWTSNIVGGPLFPWYDGERSDKWVYVNSIGSGLFSKFAYTLTVTPETLPGDYNGNGTVDAADYTVWRDTLGSTSDPRADGTGDDLAGTPDGDVDQWDYEFWKANFGNTLNSGRGSNHTAPAGVPEPASWVLILAAISFLTTYPIRSLIRTYCRSSNPWHGDT